MIPFDWIVFLTMLCGLLAVAWWCRQRMRSVADFVVVGRKMRKYLGLSTGTADGIGLVSIAFIAEQGFHNGFAYVWLMLMSMVVKVPLFGIIGFGVRRFRATRVQTIPQYHEMRYSRGVRIGVGITMAVGGILNMAIFPLVSAHFLVTFMGLPTTLSILDCQIQTIHLCMILLISISLSTALMGGMVTVIVTDYLQSLVLALSMFLIAVLIVMKIGLTGIDESLTTNLGQAAFNPFVADNIAGYGLVWILFFVMSDVLAPLSFPPSVAKLSSTDNTDTVRKMVLLQFLFDKGRSMMILLWGIGAMAVLGAMAPENIPETEWARYASATFIRDISPIGLVGFCAAGLVFAYVTTDNSYYLSWSAIIVNDVVAPLRKTPLTQKQHLRLLRIIMTCIALFMLIWGMFFRLQETIFSYIMLTGTIFTAAGIITFVGLYWKRATSLGAYLAMGIGMAIPLADLIGKQIMEDAYPLKEHQSGLLTLVLAFLALGICGVCSKSGLAKWKNYGELVHLEDQQRRAARQSEAGHE